jgi:virginiamycin B lyase
VGQQGNYVATFDPTTEALRQYEIEAGTNPHTVIVDSNGFAWYAGNRNGRIGRIDPATGELKIFMMPEEIRDPHTMAFDGVGDLWFTAQGSNRIGRLDPATGEVDVIVPNETPSNPYGLVLDAQGNPWAMLLRTNVMVKIDPATLALTRYEQASPQSRGRRLDVTSDGMVWYVDEARGYLGRIDPATRAVKEWQTPGGPQGNPDALTKDDRGRIWISETGPVKQLVGFDPATETFFAIHSVSGGIRHMNFDPRTGALWFGTDANRIGRILVHSAATN